MKIITLLLLIISPVSYSLTVRCGNMLDVNAAKMLTDIYLEMRNEVFVKVEKYTNQQIDLDLSDKYCLPGLIDTHTHLSFEFGRDSYTERFQLNEADYAFKSITFAYKTLKAGFTTVRDLGDVFNVTIALKKAIQKGWVQGPRIYTAGKSLATTGGHADPSNGYRKGLLPNMGPENGVINGVAQAAQAVRQRYKDGADLIKITATGGVLSQASSGDNAQFNMDELQSIIATANDYGFKVTAHAHGKEGMKRAIIAGVASIEHGTYLDDEIIKLMKQHGTYLVPTLIAGNWVTEKSKVPGFFPKVIAKKAATIGPVIAKSFEKAHRAGVNIALGTDSGVSAHGDNPKEFALMVKAGMTPMQAIAAATINAATLLGRLDKLGSIEIGKYADLVVVTENPLNKIETLEDVKVVIKAGIVEFPRFTD
ncbi:Xaa-Pro dipeptidase family enzyme [hydrothermal vent metagenome]|uniref:Xaa-Pro dipeptidase family enzyme n=1 Tax=hydrothermal vent metagenome TaxID=652676 RepID=A0A3B0VQT1_9ZZZZ